jgi:heat shock protein HslJ
VPIARRPEAQVEFAMRPHPRFLVGSSAWLGAICLVLCFIIPAPVVADTTFPYDSELMLDTKPMKGSKRVPILEIKGKGEAAIDLWCNSVEAQVVVAESTITILTGRKTDRQCDPARMRGDDDLLAALQQVTSWRREGHVLTLRGGKTLRFYQHTN